MYTPTNTSERVLITKLRPHVPERHRNAAHWTTTSKLQELEAFFNVMIEWDEDRESMEDMQPDVDHSQLDLAAAATALQDAQQRFDKLNGGSVNAASDPDSSKSPGKNGTFRGGQIKSCFNCGPTDHLISACPTKSKGRSKYFP